MLQCTNSLSINGARCVSSTSFGPKRALETKYWVKKSKVPYLKIGPNWNYEYSYMKGLSFFLQYFPNFFISSHSPKICSGGVFQTWLYLVCLCLWLGQKSSLVVLLKKLQLQKKITMFWDLQEYLLCNLTLTLIPEKMMTKNCVYTYTLHMS